MTTPPPSIVDVYMPISDFRTPEGDIVNESFITESWLVDQWIGDQLWTWGNNIYGELGTNNTTIRSTPVTTLSGGNNWKQVSCATFHTAAIKTDGTLWAWGINIDGQLGINNTANRNTPVTTFAGGNNWKQVSAGSNLTSAIKTDGTLWIWGSGAEGRLGTNDTTQRNTPVTTFAGGTNWKQVSAGQNHTSAIKTDGTLWTWGWAGLGQLGTNAISSGTNGGPNRLTPVTTFAGGNNWKQVSAGSVHTAAIKTDGTLWTWGFGSLGQLGTNDAVERCTPVTTFAGGNDWKQVSCGNDFTTAIKTDGSLWVWGYNFSAQLGINNTANRNTPVTTFAGGNNWKQVSCGNIHASAIKTEGTLWMWGLNSYGKLGINDANNRLTPVTTFAGGTNWKQVSAGGNHTAAVTSGPDY
jgi:alpha-tubulin suppressor-like RCC1 family protein